MLIDTKPEPQPGLPEPDKPSNLAVVLDDIVGELRCFFVMSERDMAIVALWVAYTHAYGVFRTCPRLIVWAKTSGAGKTALMEFIAPLVPNPHVNYVTTGQSLRDDVVHEAMEKAKGNGAPYVFLLDEVDQVTFTKLLFGVLNTGFHRGGVLRIKGKPYVCCQPMALFRRVEADWSGRLDILTNPRFDAILTRSILLGMVQQDLSNPEHGREDWVFRTRTDDERLGRLHRNLSLAVKKRLDALEAWLPTKGEYVSPIPRRVTVWAPLIAIADTAGGHWPETARRVARETDEATAALAKPAGPHAPHNHRGFSRDRVAVTLMDYLQCGAQVSLSELHRLAFRHNVPAAIVAEAIDALVAEGRIIRREHPPSPSGGRRRTTVELKPPALAEPQPTSAPIEAPAPALLPEPAPAPRSFVRWRKLPFGFGRPSPRAGEGRRFDYRLGPAREQLEAFEHGSIDLFLTSPPYYNQKLYNGRRGLGNEGKPEDYLAALEEQFAPTLRKARATGSLVVVIGDSVHDGVPLEIPDRLKACLRGIGWNWRRTFIWNKKTGQPQQGQPRQVSEQILWFTKHPTDFYLSPEGWRIRRRQSLKPADYDDLLQKIYRADATEEGKAWAIAELNRRWQAGEHYIRIKTRGTQPQHADGLNPRSKERELEEYGFKFYTFDPIWESVPDVLEIPPVRQTGERIHPCPFPPGLVRPFIEILCPPGGLVCDSFAGSGTTGFVANELGRDAILIDIEDEYRRRALERHTRCTIGAG
jgi:DNA modification methylase